MGVAGLRFAQLKRSLRVRAALVGLLPELPFVCRGGCSRLDGHDPDQALRGFAAVRRADRQGALMQPVRRSSGRRDQTISIAISLPGPTQSSVVSLT